MALLSVLPSVEIQCSVKYSKRLYLSRQAEMNNITDKYRKGIDSDVEAAAEKGFISYY